MALLLGLAAGCGGAKSAETDSAATSRPSPGSPSTAAAPSVKERAVLKAYSAYWATFASVANPPQPSTKALGQYAVNPELAKAKQALMGWKRDGDVFEVSYQHYHASATITGSKAQVLDCLSVRGQVLGQGTKAVRSRTDPKPAPVRAAMTFASGSWKVTSVTAGTQPCAPSSPTVRKSR